MHFANRRRHLLDGADLFDYETMRQKTLVDELNHWFIVRFKPDCSKMLVVYLHTFVIMILGLSARKSPLSENSIWAIYGRPGAGWPNSATKTFCSDQLSSVWTHWLPGRARSVAVKIAVTRPLCLCR